MFNVFTLPFPKFKYFFLNVHHGTALVLFVTIHRPDVTVLVDWA